MSVLKTYGDDTEGFKPSRTYRLSGKRISGFVDGREAVGQAIDLLLSTERFVHQIYSSDYGVELADLMGKPRTLVTGDIERRVREALAQDNRIKDIKNFNISFAGENMLVSFDAVTDFGDIPIERGVQLGI